MSAKKRILIIEDDVILLNLLKDKISKEGFDVSFVSEGDLAIEEMRNNKPDLILLDMLLPGMSGMEILEIKYKDDDIKDVPVIIISNSGQPIEIDRAKELGVKDFLIKAEFDPDEILEKVKLVFGDDTKNNTKLVNEQNYNNTNIYMDQNLILIVEDDKFLKDLLSRKLKKEGLKTVEAMDGETALSMMKKSIPRIVLLDLILPGMSGFEVLEKMKEDTDISSIPVIILSNLGEEKDRERAMELGAKKFLVKAQHTTEEIVLEIRKVLSENYAP